MRKLLLLAAISAIPGRALAADQLQFGPAPAWAKIRAIPAAPPSSNAPVSLLLSDEQFRLEPGRLTKFSQGAIKVVTSDGLAAGNISLSWNPAHDTVTVHRLEIRRGGEVIDVLKDHKFTILRRETNLEQAMLNGILTANIQAEGLREGDVLVLSTTVIHADPALKGHVEASYGAWNGMPLAEASATVTFPASLAVQHRESGGLPTATVSENGGERTILISGRAIEPLVLPKDAPDRFRIGRLGQVTDFRSWSDAGRLFQPLYKDAARIPAKGPLRDEVEKIRTATRDPKARARLALQMVQKQVRYVALSFGQGGYVPASAEESWSRRFGDCKAKTALLLAILGEFDIAAEPVAVSIRGGDAIADQLPMIGLFDHVLVRATIGGRSYWLDGTRSGDDDLDRIETPDFGWGLPLVAGARLVRMIPAPLTEPAEDLAVDIDASAGVLGELKVTARQVMRGDDAVALDKMLTAMTAEQRTAFFDAYWREQLDFVTPANARGRFDAAAGQYTLDLSGTGKFDWNGDTFWLPNSDLGYDADFKRTTGVDREAPVAMAYPRFVRHVTTVKVPPGFFGSRKDGAVQPIDETVAGVTYRRTVSRTGDTMRIETSERALVPEVPYAQALAAQPRLRALADEDLALTMPNGYLASAADQKAMDADTPASFEAYLNRGYRYMNVGRYDAAAADMTKALEAKPDSANALANRALANIYRDRLDDAAKDVAAASKIDADELITLHAAGLLAERRVNLAAALAQYDKALTVNPKDRWALGRKAQVERASNADAAALATSERALALNPDDVDLRLMRANILLGDGRTDDALKEAQAILAHAGNVSYAYVVAGRILTRVGRRDEGRAALDKAIALQPSTVAYLNRLYIRPRSDRAGRLADLEAASRLSPNDTEVIATRASMAFEAGRFADAAADYKIVLKDDDDPTSGTRARYAVALWKSGKVDEARSILADIRSKSDQATELNSLCWELATSDLAIDSALEACNAAIRKAPDRAGYLDSLALAQFRAGKLQDALATYDRALKLSPALSSSLMGRALLLAKLGRMKEAADTAAKARSLDPQIADRFAGYGLSLQREAR